MRLPAARPSGQFRDLARAVEALRGQLHRTKSEPVDSEIPTKAEGRDICSGGHGIHKLCPFLFQLSLREAEDEHVAAIAERGTASA